MEIQSRITHPVFIKNVYGEFLLSCNWDEYLESDKGKVEYLIGIVRNKYQLEDFDADFLGEVAISWNNYKHELDLSEKELEEFEIAATSLGIL